MHQGRKRNTITVMRGVAKSDINYYSRRRLNAVTGWAKEKRNSCCQISHKLNVIVHCAHLHWCTIKRRRLCTFALVNRHHKTVWACAVLWLPKLLIFFIHVPPSFHTFFRGLRQRPVERGSQLTLGTNGKVSPISPAKASQTRVP